MAPDYSHHQDAHPHSYWIGFLSCPEKGQKLRFIQLQRGSKSHFQSCPQCLRCKAYYYTIINGVKKNNKNNNCMRLVTQALKHFLTNPDFSSGPSHTSQGEQESLSVESQSRNSVIPQQEEDGWIKAIKFPSAVIGSIDWKWHTPAATLQLMTLTSSALLGTHAGEGAAWVW